MLSLNIINQTFLEKGEEIYLGNFHKLFAFFADLEKWKNLKGEINLILIDDAEIQVLNQNYRKIDKPTDILSFPYLAFEEIKKNTEGNLTIGEIFISRQRAIADAKDLKITLAEELNKLLVHGILHILGYDHIDDNDFLEMQKMENLILEGFRKKILSE